MAIVPLDKMRNFMDISEAAEILLKKSEKEITFNVNLKTGKDRIIFCDAFLVYHNVVLGPAKGGIRISSGVSLEETRKLAEIMTYKNALAGLPFGGGKSGMKVNIENIDEFTRVALIKEFVHMIREELISGAYIPAPDLGSGPEDMAVIYGETHIPESVTGKPVRIGGLPGRKEATGRSVAISTLLASEKILKEKISSCKVAIQGFGNVGRNTAIFLEEMGARIVAISDKYGGVFNNKGLDLKSLLNYAPTKYQSVAGFPEGENIKNEELLNLDVDILIPAATGGVINENNASSIKAKVIIEGANDPITEKGDEILEKKGIKVLPDILCNSGGVIASYVEWRNAKSGNQTDKEEVYEIIDRKIEQCFNNILRIKKELKTSFRISATFLSLNELIEAMKERRWL